MRKVECVVKLHNRWCVDLLGSAVTVPLHRHSASVHSTDLNDRTGQALEFKWQSLRVLKSLDKAVYCAFLSKSAAFD